MRHCIEYQGRKILYWIGRCKHCSEPMQVFMSHGATKCIDCQQDDKLFIHDIFFRIYRSNEIIELKRTGILKQKFLGKNYKKEYKSKLYNLF